MAVSEVDPKKKKGRPRDVPTIDSALLHLLTPADQSAVRERARAAALEEKRKLAEEQYYEQALEEERRALEPEQELQDIIINLAPFAQYIMLDGRQYHHGLKYRVTKAVFDTIQEITARGWAHDDEVGSPNRKSYQKPLGLGVSNYSSIRPSPRNTVISPRTVGM